MSQALRLEGQNMLFRIILIVRKLKNTNICIVIL